MRSLVYSNTAKPKRPVCPRCEKKGISVWHTLDTFRDRKCRYCGYTEFQTFVMDYHSYRGNWQTTESDKERGASFNGISIDEMERAITKLGFSELSS